MAQSHLTLCSGQQKAGGHEPIQIGSIWESIYQFVVQFLIQPYNPGMCKQLGGADSKTKKGRNVAQPRKREPKGNCNSQQQLILWIFCPSQKSAVVPLDELPLHLSTQHKYSRGPYCCFLQKLISVTSQHPFTGIQESNVISVLQEPALH